MTTAIQPNMIPMRDVNLISSGDQLFYELGYKKSIHLGYGDNWVRLGQFKEIEDPIRYVELDQLLNNVEYLEHHNFMLIKNGNDK